MLEWLTARSTQLAAFFTTANLHVSGGLPLLGLRRVLERMGRSCPIKRCTGSREMRRGRMGSFC